MGHAHAKLLKLRLFLEGIETPCVAASIGAATGSSMTCSLQIPPLDSATKLLPRTTVHLFFFDPFDQRTPFRSGRQELVEDPRQNPTAYEKQAREISDSDEFLAQMKQEGYKLCFCGEVVGFQWTKQFMTKSVVLQCLDFYNYLDYAYQADNTDIFGPGLKAVFSGSSTNLFTDFLVDEGSVLVGLVLSGTCQTFPNAKGLSAGVVRLIEAVMGSYYPPVSNKQQQAPKRYAGQNIFFTFAELRLHLLQMIAMYEDDPTTQRLLSGGGWDGLFGRSLGALGSQVSIRAAMQAIGGVIFHELSPQPCPRYLPGLEGTVSGQQRVKLSDDPAYRDVQLAADLALDGIARASASLDEMASSTEEFVDREGAPAADVQEVQREGKQVRDDLRQWVSRTKSIFSWAVTKLGDPKLEVVRGIFTTANKDLTQFDFLLQQWFPGAPATRIQQLKEQLQKVQGGVSRIPDITYATTPYSNRRPARLVQQVYHPDCWFAPPPRCNVFFPEHYTEFSYQRMFLQEPTRLLLKTNDEFFGEDELFDRFFFAPKAGSVKKDQARLQDMFNNDLLGHELFTGILPIFEKMGEFNVYASRKGERQQTDKVGLAQRTVNFLYFKHRFNSRQSRLSCRFNPYLAVGFPGLIIDRYIDRDTVERLTKLRQQVQKDMTARGKDGSDLFPTLEIPNILGTSFLGGLAAVQHTLSVSGPEASTNVTLTYTRQPDESVEFFGVLDKEDAAAKQEVLPEKVVTECAVVEVPVVGEKGPQGGKITEVRNITPSYEGEVESVQALQDELAGGRLLPLFISGQGLTKVLVRAPAEVELRGTEYQKLPGYQDGVLKGTTQVFRLTEEVPRYARLRYQLPAEEYIRPGWYGDIWSSAQVGKVYRSFFGVGSICDPQEVSDGNRSVAETLEGKSEGDVDNVSATSRDPQRRHDVFVASLKEGASIEQAVEYLVELYSYVKRNSRNADEFLEAYTWRPIASLIDMFGTMDLEFDETGSNVVQGIEGFHSRAFGPYDDAFGLVSPELEDIVGIRRGTAAAQRVDTRRRKRDMVQRMVSELRFGRGQLG